MNQNVAPAIDSHAHVFGPGRYRISPNTTYPPPEGDGVTAAAYMRVLDTHGMRHALLVSAEPYGTDNRCMLDAIADAPTRLKGIALVAPDISDAELERLVAQGVVGIRFNLFSFGHSQFDHPATPRLLGRLKELGLYLQVHGEKDQFAPVIPMLQRSGVRILIDHFGRPDAMRGVDQPGFAAILELGRSTESVIKLSGPYRSSLTGYPYRDIDGFVAAAIQAFTLDRCIWGSDWPFVRHDTHIDYGEELSCVSRWLPDSKDRKKLLWDSPRHLFGFA
jgi:predicted TIM-barrel fold metal-dependent hydrolase